MNPGGGAITGRTLGGADRSICAEWVSSWARARAVALATGGGMIVSGIAHPHTETLAKLFTSAMNARPHRALRQIETRGDFANRQPFEHQPQHFELRER